jgi:hypothetical protein
MSGEGNRVILTQNPSDDVLARSPGLLVDDTENVLDWLAQRCIFRPAGERLGDRIQEGNLAGSVSRQDGVTDAGEGHAKPFPLLAEGFFGLLVLGDFFGQSFVGPAEFFRARLDQLFQMITMMAHFGFRFFAPDVFLFEEEKDSNQQQKAQNAAGQEGLERFASLGAFCGDPQVQQPFLFSLGLGNSPANLIHQVLARVRDHDREGGWQALTSPEFDR